MRRQHLAAMCLAVWLFPVLAAAQQLSALDGVRRDIADRLASAPAVDSTSLLGEPDYLVLVARQGSLVSLLQTFEERRSDKQLGATSSASGTTTLVSKGTVPKVLGLAVENGAVTQSQSGTVVTFRMNPAGAVRALADKGYIDLTPRDFGADPALALLSRVSASASFDTSRGAGAAGDFTGDQQQLSQWTARIELINRRDPNGRQALALWQQRLAGRLHEIAAGAFDLRMLIDADQVLKRWVDATTVAINAARDATVGKSADERTDAVASALAQQEASFPAPETLLTSTRTALLRYDRSAVAFISDRERVLAEVANGPLASVEYTNDRPLNGASTSNYRFAGAVGGTVELTGNASVTLYDHAPASGGSVRDYEVSGQMDVHLGSAVTTGGFVFSIAGKWMDQRQDTIDGAGLVIPDTKGTWKVIQAKLLIPLKGTGARIPFSLTLANRNELIKEQVVRANVGVSYDLDLLFARFKPF